MDKEKLVDLIKKIGESKILVVGDLALDEMVYGDTERISREAPVLILKHSHTNLILGAASNAAHNVSTINNGKIINAAPHTTYGVVRTFLLIHYHRLFII